MRRRRRVQTDRAGIAAPVPAPVARPRDTFLPFTGRAESGQLEQLARSLSSINSNLSRFGQGLSQRQAQSDTQEGVTSLQEMAQEQADIREAVNAGSLHPAESGHFKASLQSETGKLAALQFRDSFVVDNADLLANGTDLDEFDQAAKDGLERFLDGLDDKQVTEAFDVGFNATQFALITRMRAEFANGAANRLVDRSFTVLKSDVFASVFTDLQDGVSLDNIAAGITELLDERFLTTDLTPTMVAQARRITATAIGEVGDELNRLDVLDLIDKVNVGPAGAGGRPKLLFDTQDIKEQFRDGIVADVERSASAETRRQNKERKEGLDTIATSAIEAIFDSDDRSSVDLAPFMAQALALDPLGNFSSALQNTQNVLGNQQVQTDTLLMNSLAGDIWTKPIGTVTAQGIVAAMGGGRLAVGDANFLMGQIRLRAESEQSGSDASDLVRNPIFINERGNLQARFGLSVGGFPADPERGAVAEALLTMRYLDLAGTERGASLISSGSGLQEWLSAQSLAIINDLGRTALSIGQIGEIPGPGATQDKEQTFDFTSDEVMTFTTLSRILTEIADGQPFSTESLRLLQSLRVDPNDNEAMAALLRGQKQIHGVE